MPNSVSAKKRLRQNIARRLRNRSARSAVRSQIRKVRDAVDSGDVKTSEAEYLVLRKKIDSAASKHLIHPNSAARTKSRLTKAIKALKSAK